MRETAMAAVAAQTAKGEILMRAAMAHVRAGKRLTIVHAAGSTVILPFRPADPSRGGNDGR